MGVVVEAFQEALTDVLVDERVIGDLVHPVVELCLVREIPVDQQVGDFEVGRLLCQLFDRVAAVLELALLAVHVGDRALGCCCRHEGGVVEPDSRSSFAHSSALTPPSTIGISMDSPVRLSVIVMLSATTPDLQSMTVPSDPRCLSPYRR